MKEYVENSIREGIKDGIPIALGYLSVSFTFGMMAISMGIPLEVAVIISLTNLTSAGQFAGLPLLLVNGAYIEMALTQFIINLRYALMSLSLSQKIDPHLSSKDRAFMAFSITDEIFALASNKKGKIGKHYYFALSITPIIAWTLGTFLGGKASELLPEILRNALQIAIYGMFLAIIIPPAKKLSSIKKCVMLAAVLSCSFALISCYLPIGSGFSVIICTIISAGLMAYLYPVKEAYDE
ncbi:MAG: branched-chain amino acid ABC transporter permease [Erysipelotrichia bacterium]|nr:branched-chain amino acid ABC transporter permease [Erysipelotrichia bacterium]NCC54735.1 branched-chain amino acid ABC transporter permease [Erysipelotrichia bacterium]